MTATLLPPDVRRMFAELERRLTVLERRITNAGAATVDDSHEILFSYAGALTASTSPPARVRRSGHLAVLAVTLGTAGSTSTVLTVKKNGTAIATVTVPSSATTHNELIAVRIVAEDILTLTITTAGTGAADMTAEARFT